MHNWSQSCILQWSVFWSPQVIQLLAQAKLCGCSLCLTQLVSGRLANRCLARCQRHWINSQNHSNPSLWSSLLITHSNTTGNAEQKNLETQQQNIVSFQQKISCQGHRGGQAGDVGQLVEDLLGIQKTRVWSSESCPLAQESGRRSRQKDQEFKVILWYKSSFSSNPDRTHEILSQKKGLEALMSTE